MAAASSSEAAPPFFPVAAEPADLDAIDEILPKAVWLTNYRSASKPDEMRRLKITHIVAIGTEFHDDAMEGIVHWKHDLYDDESAATEMSSVLRDGADFIHKAIIANGRVLVHCAAGISRSATIVLAYDLIHRKMKLRDAFRDLINRRRVIWPNDGFMGKLIALEKDLNGGNATIDIEEYAVWGDYDGPVVQVEGEATMVSGKGDETRCALPRLMRLETFVDPATRAKELASSASSAASAAASAAATAASNAAGMVSKGAVATAKGAVGTAASAASSAGKVVSLAVQCSSSDALAESSIWSVGRGSECSEDGGSPTSRKSANRAERHKRASLATLEAQSSRHSLVTSSTPSPLTPLTPHATRDEPSRMREAIDAPAWLVALLDKLVQDDFSAVVSRFVERECRVFLVAADGCTQHTLEQSDVHRRYQRLFESRIESHLRAHKISHNRFIDALGAAHDEGVADSSLLRLLQMVEDFESFAAMMLQRAFEKGPPPGLTKV